MADFSQHPDPAIPGQSVRICLINMDLVPFVGEFITIGTDGQTYSELVITEVNDVCRDFILPPDTVGAMINDDLGHETYKINVQ